MTLSPLQIQILTAAAGDLAKWSAAEPMARQRLSKMRGVDHLYQRNDRIAAAVRHRQVPVCVEKWLGRRPTPSDAASFSRALRTLEAKGLITRVSDTRIQGQQQYTRNIQLTPEGEQVAASLSKLPADAGIQTTGTASVTSLQVLET